MKDNTLKELFRSDLQYLYNVEKQIVKALPKMAKAAADPELKDAFEEHLEESKGHVERLDKIFEDLGLKSRGKKSRGIEGLIEEGKEILEKSENLGPDVVDAALIATAQRIEHYEIAAYGTLRTYAKLLSNKDTSELLDKSLKEESKADKNLTRIAVKRVNPKIASA
ncbi:MAG: ferritin-like domain-containing protein [Deltaproteobacteria bacterium]